MEDKSGYYTNIVNDMGGNISGQITRTECCNKLKSMLNKEYMCGMLYMFTLLYPKHTKILNKLALAKSEKDMIEIISKKFLIGE